MTQPVYNLEQLTKQRPGFARYTALSTYIAHGRTKLAAAVALRDEDIRLIAAQHGKSKAARMTGLSLSTVKAACKGAPA